jgi:ABC-type Fe3+-hydroxamate transport system substrate-binding protein
LYRKFKYYPLFFLFLSCGNAENTTKINGIYNRIVSLSPSITRQIIDLKADGDLVGVTKFHPKLKRKIEIIGTIVTINYEKIISLKPDIILLSDEDNSVQNIERLKSIGIKIYSFKKNKDYKSICKNYIILGEILNKKDYTLKKIENYNKKLERVKKKIRSKKENPRKIAFFLSHRPLITVSGRSFIGSMIVDSGARNVFNDLKQSFPIISLESIIIREPDLIISTMKKPEVFFNDILGKFIKIPAIKNNKIFYMTDKNILYYTPKDYIKGIELLFNIIE